MLGITINSFTSADLISKYGWHKCLMTVTFANCLAYLMLLIPNFIIMYAARFIAGYAGGFCFNLPIIYFKELFPQSLG